MTNREFLHFQPESAFMPSSPESKELERRTEINFITDPESGNIIKIGDPRDVREWIESKKNEDPELEIKSECGDAALPGMTDAHNHLLYGTLDVIDAGYAFGIESEKQLSDLINQQAKNSDKNVPKMIIGHNTAAIPNFFKKDLDQSSPECPICLVDASFHGARLNSPMMKLLRNAAEQELKNGNRLTGTLNEKTGQATESYAILALQVAESYHGIEKISEGMESKLDEWVGKGITDMHELFPLSWTDLTAMLMTRKKWEEERKTKFPVREIFMSPVLLEKLRQNQQALEKAGLFNPDTDWKMVGFKLLADGSIGSHTAMMRDEYNDVGGKGAEFNSFKELNQTIKMAREYGIDKIAMHAIGDAGIYRALETAKNWKRTAESAKIDPSKFRIEHFTLGGDSKLLDQAQELGVWINSEPNFLSDFHYKDRLSGRVSLICPHADILEKGINMHFGSDGMPTSALFGIWAATHHPNPKQRISFEQALAAYSLMSADYENSGRGRIVEGAPADILLLNQSTLNKLLTGDGSVEQFEKFGDDSTLMDNKAAELEAGIAKIYRQGKLVKNSIG